MSPTLVIVPGSFSTCAMYDPVVVPLREKGYKVLVLDLPCYPDHYAPGKAAPSMFDDARRVREVVEGMVDSGEEIVMLAHSYGGVPLTQSLEMISKPARSAGEKKGGISRIAYISAITPSVGENLIVTIAGNGKHQSMPPMDVDENGWLLQTDATSTAALCFNSLPIEQAIPLAAKLTRHSGVAFRDELTYAGYKDVDVSWFFCEEDKCIVPEVQQAAIDRIEQSWKGTEREGNKVNVKRVACDHVPVFSARDELIAWMEGLLK